MKRFFSIAVLMAFAFPLSMQAQEAAPEAEDTVPAEAVENDEHPEPPPAEADRPLPPEGDKDFRPGPPPKDGDFPPEPPRHGDFRGSRPTPPVLKFEDFDTNKDGVIDKGEFKKIQKLISRPPMPPRDVHGSRGPHDGENAGRPPMPPKKGDMKKNPKKHAPMKPAPPKDEDTQDSEK